MLLAAPQGFEPRYADPESAVLPLNEGAASGVQAHLAANWHRDPEQGSTTNMFILRFIPGVVNVGPRGNRTLPQSGATARREGRTGAKLNQKF